MFAKVEGLVLGVEQYVEKKDNETYLKAMLFQEGQKRNPEVKKIPVGTKIELMKKSSFNCKLYPWANDKGAADISCTFLGMGKVE